MRAEKEAMLQNAIGLRHRYRLASMEGTFRPFHIPLRFEGLVNTALHATRGTGWANEACNGGMSQWLNHLWYALSAFDRGYPFIADRTPDNVSLTTLLLLTLDGSFENLSLMMYSGPYHAIANRYLSSWEICLGRTEAPTTLTDSTRGYLNNVWTDLSLVRSVKDAYAYRDGEMTATDILINAIYRV